MKILHFSDPHAGSGAESWRALFDKRIVGVFNYSFRRRFRFDLGRLGRLAEYVRENPVDAIVCTGDLTSAGQPREFARIMPYMEELKASGAPFVYVPGNHDCYVRDRICAAAVRTVFRELNDGLELEELPLARTIGECDFVMYNASRPSNLLCSWGFVRTADSGRLEEICSGAKTRPRILVGHFPLYEDHPVLRFRHRLFGQGEVLRLLEERKLDLSLAGHVHKPLARVDGRGRGENISGSITANGCAALVEYDRDSDVFRFSKLEFER